MRKTLTTAALLLALCCPAFAGVMHTPPAPQPPPQNAQEATTDGDMHFPLVQLALSVLALL